MSDVLADENSNRGKWLIVVIVVAAVLVGIGWWWLLTQKTPTVTDIPVTTMEPEVITGPIQRAEPEDLPSTDTVAEESAPAPEPVVLPPLNESDEPMIELAESLSPDGQLVKLLLPERVLLKLVRSVIAMDESDVVKDHRPIASPSPPFKVQQIDEPVDADIGPRFRIDPANYQRYTPYVDAFAALKPADVAVLYHRYYPLLDQAYKQYGVDRGGFLNVTLRAIDKLTAVKISEEDPILVQPKVFYQFQDPALEASSAQEKLFLRMGSENAQRFQDSLRKLRAELVKAQQ